MNQVRFEVFGYDGSLRGDVWARSASEACTSAHKLSWATLASSTRSP